VDDVDSALGDVPGESGLVRQRSDTAKRGNVVLAQWNAAFVEFADETALAPQTREFQIEATRVERASERHELSFGAAAPQRRNHLQQADAGRAVAIRRPAVPPL
jgi:hypothetical protein